MPFIQDKQGSYRAKGAISADEILNEAAAIVTRQTLERSTDVLSSPDEASRLFKARLRHLEHEEFHVAYLDCRHRVIAVAAEFRGCQDGCEVHPREIVKAALKHNAAALIVGHGHPSGDPTPSAADRAVTARLKQALALVDVRLLDHLVVGGDQVTSLAARGWV